MDEDPSKADDARRGPHRPAGWALGLPAVTFVWLVASLALVPRIERDIRREATRLTSRDGANAPLWAGARSEVDGRDVRIVADPGASDGALSELETAIRDVPGVRTVRTEVRAPAGMSPFEMTIRRDANGLSLRGGVPTAGLRGELLALAASIVAPDALDDRLDVATGAPAGFTEAARWALGLVARAKSGEVTLRDGRVAIDLDTVDRTAYGAIMTALAVPPAGLSLSEVQVRPPFMTPFLWSARREGGQVILSGGVPSEEIRAQMTALVAVAVPGLAVRDEMATSRGLDPEIDALAVARWAFAGLAPLTAGRVSLDDGRLSVSGESVAKVRVAEVQRGLRTGLPAGTDLGDINVKVVPASPFTFTARREAGRVVLSGFTPDEAARKSVALVMASRFPGDRLVDGRVVADGAAGGFPEAERAAIDTLSTLAEGEVAIVDREIRVSGRMLYAQMAARLKETVPRIGPPGWTARIALDPVTPERAIDRALCADLLADKARREPILFEPGKAEPAAASRTAFDAVADIVLRCGSVPIRIVHRLRQEGAAAQNEGLAARRATTIVAQLAARGATARLTALGIGALPQADEPAERTDFEVGSP